MRRLARYALNALTALSLLLCVATVVLWVRSYTLTDQIFWQHAGGLRCIGSASGYVVVQLNPLPASAPPPPNQGVTYLRMQPYSAPHYLVAYPRPEAGDAFSDWEHGGLGWFTLRNKAGLRAATGVAAFGWFAAVTAIVPAGWAATRLRSYARARRRTLVGRCTRCRYSLTGNVSGVCPECGTPIRPATA